MNKKTIHIMIALLLITVLVTSLSACSGGETAPPKIPDNPPSDGYEADLDFVMLRQVMMDATDVAAVAYLGYYEGGYEGLAVYLEEKGFLDSYPFMAKLPESQYIEHEGYELYCVVPLNEDAQVAVYDWIVSEKNDYKGEPGTVLYQNDKGSPFLIKGNMSEIIPNMYVEITDADDYSLKYVPSLSMMDGTLVKPVTVPTIYDFSPYDALGYEYGFTSDHLTAVGSWVTSAYTVNQENVEGALYFSDSGEMQFCYAIHEGEPYKVFYEGVWYMAEGNTEEEDIPDDAVVIELKLVEDNSELQVAKSEIFTVMTFEKDPAQTSVYMHYVAGDYLFDNEQFFDYLLKPTVG